MHKARARSAGRRLEKTGILLAAPALALLVLLFAYPIFFNFYMSFFRLNLYVSTEKTFIGFDNYVSILQDSLFYGALMNTTFFALASVALEFIIGLVLALLLSKIKGIWMGILGAALMIPMFLSEIIEGVVGQLLFSPRIGLINAFTKSLFGVEFPWITSKTLAMWTIVIVDTWKMLPFFILIFLAAIVSIPKDMEEAMNLDGASTLQQVRYLIIPYMLPVFAIATVMRAIDAFTKVFGVVYVITFGGPGLATDVVPLRIFNLALRAFHWGSAATWGVFAFLISTILVAMYIFVKRRWT